MAKAVNASSRAKNIGEQLSDWIDIYLLRRFLAYFGLLMLRSCFCSTCSLLRILERYRKAWRSVSNRGEIFWYPPYFSTAIATECTGVGLVTAGRDEQENEIVA